MPAQSSDTGYGWISQCFHWLIAALIVTQYVLGKAAELAGESDQLVAQLALVARHKSVGITVLLLTTLRLVWRFISPPPPLPRTMPPWQVVTARLTHTLIYALVFTLPVSGWLMSSASSYTVSVFGWFELPNLVAADEALEQNLKDLHHLLGLVLFVAVLIHIAAALKHQFIDKDTVLQTMMPASSFLLFVAATGVAVWLGVGAPTSAQTPQPVTITGDNKQRPPPDSQLPIWQINYARSFITFEGDQAGASFSGRWQTFDAAVQFDTKHLNESAASVTINIGSVDTRDQERNDIIKSADFFDVVQYPTVAFTAGEFERRPDGSYLARGTLSIKSVASPVDFVFAVEEHGTHKVLTGRAELDRLALGVGTGEWLDTSWVGRMVKVQVRLETEPQAHGKAPFESAPPKR